MEQWTNSETRKLNQRPIENMGRIQVKETIIITWFEPRNIELPKFNMNRVIQY